MLCGDLSSFSSLCSWIDRGASPAPALVILHKLQRPNSQLSSDTTKFTNLALHLSSQTFTAAPTPARAAARCCFSLLLLPLCYCLLLTITITMMNLQATSTTLYLALLMLLLVRVELGARVDEGALPWRVT